MDWFGIVASLAAGPGLWANDDSAVRTVIGTQTPLYHLCYENARDGADDYDALEPCNQSLDEENLSPRKTAILHVNRGVILFNIGDYDAAVDDFSAALDLDIHVEAKVLANRGLSYEALNYEGLARADYRAALAINPENKLAARRLRELDKPLYDRSRLPKKITAEAPAPAEI